LGPTTTLPQPQADLAAQAIWTTQMDVPWVAPANNNEYGFQVQQSSDSVRFQQIVTANAGSTSFLVTGLQPAATYTYRVYAFVPAHESWGGLLHLRIDILVAVELTLRQPPMLGAGDARNSRN
jgi:hypothetical protein